MKKEYKCKICGNIYDNKDKQKKCETMCASMVSAYMEVENLTYNDALEKFRMELL